MRETEAIDKAKDVTVELTGIEYVEHELENAIADNEEYYTLAYSYHRLKMANRIAQSNNEDEKYTDILEKIKERIQTLIATIVEEESVPIYTFKGTVVDTSGNKVIVTSGYVTQKYEKERFHGDNPGLGDTIRVIRKEDGLSWENKSNNDQ